MFHRLSLHAAGRACGRNRRHGDNFHSWLAEPLQQVRLVELEAASGLEQREALGIAAPDKGRSSNTEMNTISVIGKVNRDAMATLVKNSDGAETPLVSFTLMDTGLPYMKSDPMFIEVNFMREPAMHLSTFLKKGKEIMVTGCLRSKTYVTQGGEKKTKYFISADYVLLTGQRQIEKGAQNEN